MGGHIIGTKSRRASAGNAGDLDALMDSIKNGGRQNVASLNFNAVYLKHKLAKPACPTPSTANDKFRRTAINCTEHGTHSTSRNRSTTHLQLWIVGGHGDELHNYLASNNPPSWWSHLALVAAPHWRVINRHDDIASGGDGGMRNRSYAVGENVAFSMLKSWDSSDVGFPDSENSRLLYDAFFLKLEIKETTETSQLFDRGPSLFSLTTSLVRHGKEYPSMCCLGLLDLPHKSH
ncbi:blood brain barrier large neutral amino acid [Echinococcus multilocularis]|uniref:Blood brain barrier large neutral amino acid n=1 Tax=Echinococcus multilocularis TaxID=6211 RepID=A0A068Y5G2_ECHMU|nr:blood brain barrier large neutral amino acid [Echinococcus multilocularis]